MALGGEKVQEAYYIYQEMIDKLGSTALLLNGQAVTFLAQGKYAEAEAALAEAIEKDPNNPETLVNMIVLAHHQGKQPEVIIHMCRTVVIITCCGVSRFLTGISLS